MQSWKKLMQVETSFALLAKRNVLQSKDCEDEMAKMKRSKKVMEVEDRCK